MLTGGLRCATTTGYYLLNPPGCSMLNTTNGYSLTPRVEQPVKGSLATVANRD
jgi:hypothetical protein